MTALVASSASAERQHNALQTIFSFFLGLMVVAFIGVGWVVFSGSSMARFAVMAFALGMSIALGWVKFVRGRARAAVPAVAAQIASTGAGDAALAGLEARVSALEERAAAAAVALGGRPERDGS